MQTFTISSKIDHIKALCERYGPDLMPAKDIKGNLGDEVFRDLIGLRYIRKAGYLAPNGTFSTRRTSNYDVVVYEATDTGIKRGLFTPRCTADRNVEGVAHTMLNS
ncbi:MAG TPA: hypothetical protein VN372_00685 [Methanospirillum sp.]|nr:hypothetical protein [Methanospirillum sp.]